MRKVVENYLAAETKGEEITKITWSEFKIAYNSEWTWRNCAKSWQNNELRVETVQYIRSTLHANLPIFIEAQGNKYDSYLIWQPIT